MTTLTPPPPTFAPGRIWRAGPTLVIEQHAAFPDRCVKCNQPAEGFRKKLTLSWHEPWIFALIFLGLLVYVIVGLIMTKRLAVEVPVCQACRAARRNRMLVGGSILISAIVGFVAAGVFQEGWFVLYAVVAFLGGLIWLVVAASILRPLRVEDRRMAWVKGAGPGFLDSLQAGPGL